MPVEITMPQLSDTMSEGTVVKWLKKEGDKVKAGETIAEVETDKATMEMESFESGTLALIDAREGQKVKVGERIAVLASPGEDPAAVKREFSGGKGGGAAAAAPAAAPQELAAVGTEGDMRREAERQTARATTTAPAAAAPTTAPSPPAPPPGGDQEPRIRISPLARRMAEERGLDIRSIRGSGPGGRIVQRDIEAALAGAAAPQPTPQPPTRPAAAQPLPQRIASGQKQTIPLTKMRATIAQRLQQAKQQIPHFYETIDIDVEELVNLRQRINQQLESEGVRLSLGDFIAKAVATALLRHPALNAHLAANEITRFGDVHLGMAVALPEGLIVPVLRNINQMGLREIRLRSADLVERARAQKLKGEEMSGATFTVSNLGTYGVREFSAIINPPEVGILAIGAAEKRPVVRGEAVVARTMLSVTLSADHRAVDGATAAEFLRTLKQLLEEPGMMLV
ncbi:dihydrolipoamide acetyltransferase family protein [Fontivita pretiosa]|uniref:dihydrolipoamide acetyltransferase family protein n=1 Tax=Fontivita pretiosa TaxID=2989684 RepID=UPI003D163313